MKRKVIMGIVYGGLFCTAALLALLLYIGTLPGEVTVKTHITSRSPEVTKVLFIGNSLTYTEEAPTQFAKIFRVLYDYKPLLVESATGPGLTLREHLSNKNTNKALKQQKWDYVIVQEGSQPAFHRQQEALESLRHMVKIVEDDGGKPIIVMIPADRGEPEWQKKLNDFFSLASKELKTPLMPLGEVSAFCQKQHPQLNLHDPDKHHPNLTGAMLYGCMAVKAIKPFEPVTLKDKLTKTQPDNRDGLTKDQLNTLITLTDIIEEWEQSKAQTNN